MAACSAAALGPIPPIPLPPGSVAKASHPGAPAPPLTDLLAAAAPRRKARPGLAASKATGLSGNPGGRPALGIAATTKAAAPPGLAGRRKLPLANEVGRDRRGQPLGPFRRPNGSPPLRSREVPRALGSLALLALLLASAGCQPAHLRPSWRVYPLPRQMANDGLAVVNQPDGYGLHIWLETDTSVEGLCRPRWNPAAARLFNGNGSAPFSSGLATPAEYYEAVRRGPVRQALRRQIEALCRQRAPRSDFVWSEPPRRAADYKPPPLASLEERHLLSDPDAIQRAEQKLLGAPPGEQDPDAGPSTAGPAKPAAGRGEPAAGKGSGTAGRGNATVAPRPPQAR